MNRELLKRAAMVLDHANDFTWTVQGFGMIRTYLDNEKRYRLNVWDDRLRVPAVSDIHDHPWSFTSLVLAGELRNVRYVDVGANGPGWRVQHVEIVTGEGGGPTGEPDTRFLVQKIAEVYGPGQSYVQEASEVHRTTYVPGTITLNDRTPATAAHTANVYWQDGPWVNAEPRPATKAEIYGAVEQALYQARLDRWTR